MRSSHISLRWRETVVLFCVGMIAAAAANPGVGGAAKIAGKLYERIPLPVGIAKDQYRDAVVEVLKSREWTVTQETDWQVVARMRKLAGEAPLGFLSQRGNEAIVTLVFAGNDVDLYCDGWELDKTGERTKPEMPRSWLGRLRRDLADRFEAIAAGSP